MKFDFFKRTPDFRESTKLLQILKDNFGEWGMRQLEANKTSRDLLVCFALVMTGQTAGALLRTVGQVAPHIGRVFQEVRAFYECLWQLELLHKCESPEDRAKVSRLYAEVNLRTIILTKPFFDAHPEGARPLKCAFDENYDAVLQSAVREYIQGRREVPINKSGNLYVDNGISFTLKIGRIAGLGQPALNAVHQVVRDDWTDSLTLKFLAQFDFKNCKAMGLPPSWLKQRPS